MLQADDQSNNIYEHLDSAISGFSNIQPSDILTDCPLISFIKKSNIAKSSPVEFTVSNKTYNVSVPIVSSLSSSSKYSPFASKIPVFPAAPKSPFSEEII